jgi:tRNA-specific 2-thiouridylase
MPDNKLRIVVAMSGGVDSSVAAAMLADQGHEVIGVMMRLWSDPSRENLCCTTESMSLAQRIANQLGFPFHVVNAESAFHDKVVHYFIEQYKSGTTPNPCIACNRRVRFHTLFKIAEKFGATHIASGHYARIEITTSGKVQLLRGIDREKDQSYVLHGLSQDQLDRTLFPLGTFTKAEIRDIARYYKLPVAERPDSQDLCFVGNEGYHDFLIRHAPEAVNPGPIVTTGGETLGTHKGLAFYTIGQRKGIGIAAAEPYYVLGKNTLNNTLLVGTMEELGKKELTARDLNWIAGDPPSPSFRAIIKIRYKARDAWGLVNLLPDSRIRVNFDEQLRDITPGQAAVLYNGEVCLGGGIIECDY